MVKTRHSAIGAQVLEFAGDGNGELFYCTPVMPVVPGPVRGGVPIVFPQFAESGPLQKHGFTRNLGWTLDESHVTPASVRLKYSVDISPKQFPKWPHSCHLSLIVTGSSDSLEFEFSVSNTGEDAFSFTGGLHPYFYVPDLLHARVEGLSGLSVTDRYEVDRKSEEGLNLRFSDRAFESLYDESPALNLWTGERSIALSTIGFDQWMIWNPGRDEGRLIADLPDGDWARFICIEPVRVLRPVFLAPGKTFTGALMIAISSSEK